MAFCLSIDLFGIETLWGRICDNDLNRKIILVVYGVKLNSNKFFSIEIVLCNLNFWM